MSEQTEFSKPVDTGNQFLVGSSGANLVVMRPLAGAITPAEARNLAAWLKVLADMDGTDPDGKQFERLVDAIRNS